MSSNMFAPDDDEGGEEPSTPAASQGSDQHHLSDNLSLPNSLVLDAAAEVEEQQPAAEAEERQPAADPPEPEPDHPPNLK